ncbi:hypothetical protein DFH28DRAFT_903704, partial [Melampsora americana]
NWYSLPSHIILDKPDQPLLLGEAEKYKILIHKGQANKAAKGLSMEAQLGFQSNNKQAGTFSPALPRLQD